MATKKILGLDLGTNSIGWAVVNREEDEHSTRLTGIKNQGVRIIPMDAAIMGDFESGNSVSQTKDRTAARGIRRLFERRALRRERLNRVLRILDFLPKHYAEHLNRFGQLNKGAEPKLAWKIIDGKAHFAFMDSYNEMLDEFSHTHPDLVTNNKKIAYDWTIYYLRKKALSRPLSRQELAWVLLQFNQKRGYNQARGEEEEKSNEKKEFMSLLVTDVQKDNESNGKTWYNITLENGWVYHRPSSQPLDWVGKKKNFIVTTKIDENGVEVRDKEGNVKRSFRAPDDNDWTLLKIKTEQDIIDSGKTIGEFIYDALLANPDQKIIGELVRVVERKYYKEELRRIITKQCEFIPELQDRTLFAECVEALYPQNLAYRQSIASKDFVYLFVDDLVFYQRPLKTKKSLINECPYEYRKFIKDGEEQRQYLKCISKSHPLYEEFRAWQFVDNLRIIRIAEDGITKTDCTSNYITNRCEVVKWLLTQTKVNQKILLEYLVGKKHNGFSWNYPEDKEYPSAPTTAMLIKLFDAEKYCYSKEDIDHLWHMLYSISDKTQLEQAITHYVEQMGFSEDFANKLKKTKPFAPDYGAYSEKAIKKLLTIMRSGSAWQEDSIDKKTKQRITRIITGEVSEDITDQVREKLKTLEKFSDFQGLPLWLAEYVIYDVRGNNIKWEKPEDIDDYLQKFRLHSLNNPIVEQVVKETLRTVRDIWKEEGYIDEIHLEMGRDLKQNAEQRKNAQRRQAQNEQANLRAKMLLEAFMNPDMQIEDVHPSSPNQREIFRLYEDSVLSTNVDNEAEEIKRMISGWSTIKQPTQQEIKKYRLWLEQKYISPYTGETIPLSRLFTHSYQIEHIIPQSRFFDDSMSNKVICEAEVNGLKDRMLAHEFISKCGGQKVTLSGGKIVRVLTTEEYESLVKESFKNDKNKLEKLLLDDIPEKFVARQMNDSRYISKLMKGLLSNIVREKDPKTGTYEIEATSKNLIVCTGSVTDLLKKDWGVNDAWNHIILPRFERLNQILGTTVYTATTDNGHIVPTMPINQQQGFSKKRIDHRHHAMDAIVIACATREHVNLISNEAALDKEENARYDLQFKLRQRVKWIDKDGNTRYSFSNFIKPWETFTQDVETSLRDIIVSFKQNLRVINKSSNHYTHFENGKKKTKKQENGDNWAIRKSMHKATVFGLVNLRFKKTERLSQVLGHIDDVVEKDLRFKLRELKAEGKNEKQIKQYLDNNKDVWSDINPAKIEVWYYTNDTKDRYYATRIAIDDTFTEKYIRENLTDEGIQKILLAHLAQCGGNPGIAFSPDGIEDMNKNIQILNGGVPHKPIYKVRKYEKAEKFSVGQIGSKARKFVEADKGTNLFYAIYTTQQNDGTEKRLYLTIPLQVAIQCQKDGQKDWKPLVDNWAHSEHLVDENAKLLFILSPGDLVYLPTLEEQATKLYSWQKTRIYKMVSSSGSDAYFIPSSIASPIVNKVEFTQLNKVARTPEEQLIKEVCIPIIVNRLGKIISQ